jgi:hypothetical protein
MQTNDDLFDDAVAHDLKIKPLEKDVINLEKAVGRIVSELDQLHLTERYLRDTNGTILYITK